MKGVCLERPELLIAVSSTACGVPGAVVIISECAMRFWVEGFCVKAPAAG